MEDLLEKVPEAQAILEVQNFVKKWDSKLKKEWEIKDDYPNLLQAIQFGLVSFDKDLKPVLKLKDPVLNDKEEVALGQIVFRTRIKPQELANVMKGLDISKNQVEYTLRCFAFLTGQPIAMIDKFSKFDYKVVEQLSTVFL